MSKSTILIVEDEAIVAADLAGKLRQLGYEVAGTASEGQEAILLADRLRPDLVLMDIQLEGPMDGIDAAEAIRRKVDLPIIYLTAHSDAATLARAKIGGPFGYILKPFEERELATNIEMALFKHQSDRQLRQHRDELEARTIELQTANETLRASRLAALNLMDDAVVTREIAEKTSLELQKEISERKRTEVALRESEERLRTLYTSMSEGLAIHEIVYEGEKAVDYTITDINPAFEKITGITRSTAIGVKASELYNTQEPPFLDIYSKVAATGESFYFEPYFSPMKRHFSVSAFSHSRGKFVTVFQDITERKRAENELLRLNKAMKALSDSSQAVIRAGNESAYLNKVCKIIIEDCGYSMVWIGFAENDEIKSVRPVAHAGFEDGYLETLRITWSDTERGQGPTGMAIRTGKVAVCRNMLIDPAFAPWREQAVQRGYASSIVFPLESDGTVFGALSIYSAEDDPFSEGEIKLLTELADNLSYGIEVWRVRIARRKAEENIRRQNAILEGINLTFKNTLRCGSEEELLQACLAIVEEVTQSKFGFIGELGPDGFLRNIAISDPGGEFCTMHDKSGHRKPTDFPVRGIFDRVLLDGKGFFTNDPLSHPDSVGTPEGDPQLNAFLGVPLVHGDKVFGMIGVGNREGGYRQEEMESLEALAPAVVESLHRIRAEEELRKLTVDLKRSNDDLQQFARFASHDLQAPLKTVEGFVKLFNKRYKGKIDQQSDELLGYIVESIRDMQTLIKDLLEFSRLETGSVKLKPVDSSLTLAHALANLKAEMDESGAEVTYDEHLPGVMGDQSQMTRLFQNLLSNAIKFHGEGRPRIHISVQRNDDEWVFSVRDNGIGIDPKHRDRIFDIFQRLHGKSEFPGTGMGLAMCKRIAERMGGKIWVESESGKGSIFYFTIPVRKGEQK